MSQNKVLFTDIDGTLIDKDTYSYEDSIDAVKKLKDNNIPIILCSSKTKAEIEEYRLQLGIVDPFISENGGALFIPKDYFKFKFDYELETDHYFVVELGTSYEKLRGVLDLIRNEGVNVVGFGDLNVKELSEDINYPPKLTILAKKRNYDEPFQIISAHKDQDEKIAIKIIKENNMQFTKGDRFFHIKKGNDEKKLIDILKKLYDKNNKVKTFGIGDEVNNKIMLLSVDKGYLVKRKDNTYANIEKTIKVDGIGPTGFSKVVETILS